MRMLLAGLLLLAGTAAVQAQKVDGADILRRGIYKIDKIKTIDDSSISTGQRTSATKVTFSKSADRIVTGDGVVFGLDVKIRGTPRGRNVPMRIVWRYPEPGLRNPDTGKAKFKDEYVDQRALGADSTFYWSLGEEWTQVPGTWTFELWYRDRKLVSQSFTLEKGEKGEKPAERPAQKSGGQRSNSE